MTDDTIKNVTDLATKLHNTVSDMGSALALAEQLRLFRVRMSVSNPTVSAIEKRPYSGDLGPLARNIKAEVRIGSATKGSTARPYSPKEVAVLCALFHIARSKMTLWILFCCSLSGLTHRKPIGCAPWSSRLRGCRDRNRHPGRV